MRGISTTEPAGHRAITIASWLFLANGVAWGLSSIPFAVYLDRLGRLPIIDIPLIGPIHGMGGPISRQFGVDGVVWFLIAMGLLVWIEVLAGWWLRRARKAGGWLAIILLPVSMFFWLGFALPIWIALGPIRVALVLVGWKALRSEPGIEPSFCSSGAGHRMTPGSSTEEFDMTLEGRRDNLEGKGR